jgi:PIN domain nuclease of toxin-antitoxin system
VILLDTHIWIWWVNGSDNLPATHRQAIEGSTIADGVGVSAISCLEIARLALRGRLVLSEPVAGWMERSFKKRGVLLFPLSPEVSIESERLPGDFHKDPADRIIVATSRVHELPLMTCDQLILSYPDVELWFPT